MLKPFASGVANVDEMHTKEVRGNVYFMSWIKNLDTILYLGMVVEMILRILARTISETSYKRVLIGMYMGKPESH